MTQHGYYRWPTIHSDAIIFVSEDDLWRVSSDGGRAERLTASLGTISHPLFSPDGTLVAFACRDEGVDEIYVMAADGGPAERLTYLGVNCMPVTWSQDGSAIVFVSGYGQPFRAPVLHSVPVAGGLTTPLGLGEAMSLSYGPNGGAVIGRNNNDPARWKRYRGGTAGDLWIDATGDGNFNRLITLKGNPVRPMWIGDRIYFLSDHEGIANLYSCTLAGEELKQQTFHRDYFARFPSSDGSRIVYQSGANLWVYNVAAATSTEVKIDYFGSRTQRNRKFVDAGDYLEQSSIHPTTSQLAVTARGRSFDLDAFQGAVHQHGVDDTTTRYKMTTWLHDGKGFLTVVDHDGVQRLQIHREDSLPVVLEKLDIGRPYSIEVNPTSNKVLIANHRNELLCVDLDDSSSLVVATSEYGATAGVKWSPDGRWAAYGHRTTAATVAITVWSVETGETHPITSPVLADFDPSWDPEGRYICFLANRDFMPVYDSLHFNLGFPRGCRPYLVTLQSKTLSPFVSMPEEEEKPHGAEQTGNVDTEKTQESAIKPIEIDFEDITSRVVPFPVPVGDYSQITALKTGAMWISQPIRSALDHGDDESGVLECFTYGGNKPEVLASGVKMVQVQQSGKLMLLRQGKGLRIVKAGQKLDEKAGDEPGRKSGLVDVGRIRILVDPPTEWRQMAREAWQLQKEYFWSEDMSGVDWDLVWNRYAPLLDRVGTRGEFSDLLWEMQGELGTSHAYEMGGDYRKEPHYPIGLLGATFKWDETNDTCVVDHVVQGTSGDTDFDSPLRAPGVDVRAGDVITAVNGAPVTRTQTPSRLLLNQAKNEVEITVVRDGDSRTVRVQTLRSESRALYREWVENNRQAVHARTNNRVGYLHIPDMGAYGFAEFHRLWMAESAYDGLIVDVRYNGGGHVSQLLLEKVARKPLGYDLQRWGKPESYPAYAIPGPVVAVTNQWAGSDGDIFSHSFKLMKIGPLLGKRTWGGVIGISPRNPLADGAVTTQPEFSFWFNDVGWGVENYGTDPDIDIDIAPQDYAAGKDPQLDHAIELANKQLEEIRSLRPTFGNRPRLTLPTG